jgi:hypothetical protein
MRLVAPVHDTWCKVSKIREQKQRRPSLLKAAASIRTLRHRAATVTRTIAWRVSVALDWMQICSGWDQRVHGVESSFKKPATGDLFYLDDPRSQLTNIYKSRYNSA